MKLTSLKFLLPAVLLTLLVVLTIGSNTINILSVRTLLLTRVETDLDAKIGDKIAAVQASLDEISLDVTVRAGSKAPLDAIQRMTAALTTMGPSGIQATARAYIEGNPNPLGERDTLQDALDGTPYSALHAELNDYYRAAQEEHGYYDVFLINPDGLVVYSVEKEGDFLAKVNEGALADSGLGRAWRRAMSASDDEVAFEDFAPYEPSNGAFAAFVATPVIAPNGKVAGVYAVQVPDLLNDKLSGRAAASGTGRVTVVGNDGLLRSLSGRGTGGALGDPVQMTDQIQAAIDGKRGVMMETQSEDGTTVISAYAPFDAMGATWAIVAEEDREALLAPIRDQVNQFLIEVAIIVTVMLAFGVAVTRWIALPLSALDKIINRIAQRDYAIDMPYTKRKDEIGEIARGLDEFRQRLSASMALEEEASFKSAAFRTAPVAMMIANRDGKVIHVNESVQKLFVTHGEDLRKKWPGLRPENLIGTDLASVHANHGRVMSLMSDTSRMPLRTEIVVGDLRFSIDVSAVQDAAGNLIGNVAVWDEISEQRKTAGIVDAIRRSQVVIEMTPDARIVAVNDEAAKTYAYSKDEMVGMAFSRLMYDGEAGVAELMDQLRKNGFANQLHHRVTKDGRELWVECAVNGILDGSGKLFRVVAICTDVTKTVQERSEAETRRKSVTEDQQKVVVELGRALGDLAEGDLTRTIDRDFPVEYEMLRTNFNAAVTRLDEALALVVDSAGNIRSGASEITEAADDLSRRTESQAATLEQTAAALDELTASVKSAAEGANDADRTVRTAREQAEASGAVVIEAVNAMSEIERSSRQIGQIIGVIDDIAFQTNLLALNAGVEAARAGEAGRGFAVVASEVRALAQRSSEAAKEIKQLISASSRQVENGVGLVGQTGEALKTIVAGVTEITTRVSQLAQSSREQSTGLAEINSGVTMLDQVTQQNAAMVEQSTAASHSLRKEAEGLAELVGRFRVSAAGGGGPVQRTRPSAAPAAPAKRAASAGRSTKSEWARDAGGSGWEEF
jgi:methyl-accepting chemotaxis protein